MINETNNIEISFRIFFLQVSNNFVLISIMNLLFNLMRNNNKHTNLIYYDSRHYYLVIDLMDI